MLDHLQPQPGDLAIDVGCGKGAYHPGLIARGVRAIIGLDASPAMVAATQHQANAERFLRADAFIFPTTESALLYYSSGMVEFIADPPEDGSHRNKLCERVGDAIEDIIRREGAFRVGKDSGCFVARLLAME